MVISKGRLKGRLMKNETHCGWCDSVISVSCGNKDVISYCNSCLDDIFSQQHWMGYDEGLMVDL